MTAFIPVTNFIRFTSTSLGERFCVMLGRGGICGAAAFSSPPKINGEFGGQSRCIGTRPFLKYWHDCRKLY